MFLRFTAMVLGIASAASAIAQDCPGLDGARKIESDRYVLSYRTEPSKIAVGQHFTLELAVCPKGGQPGPETIGVDGFMPEHNHGMNYKPVVKPAGARRYNVAGLMFHMPGKWEFIFDIRGGGKMDRLKDPIMLH